MRVFVFVLSVLCGAYKGTCLTIVQENFTLINRNPKIVVNTNGYISQYMHVNFSVTEEIGPHAKMLLEVQKKVKNDYKYAGMRIKTTVREVLGMDAFDVQSLFNECFVPPLKWPLKTNVLYQCKGWNPNPEKFPPAVPNGHYKIDLAFSLEDNTKLADISWYLYMYN